MSTRQIHVFISHSWAYSGQYETIRSWIFDETHRRGQAVFRFLNYSVPQDNPLHTNGTDEQLRVAIWNQIGRSHVVVLPTGMYVNYSKWIQKEIDGSSAYGKPILAVDPRGQQRTSSVAQNAAALSVKWQKKNVIDGLWQLYRS